MRNEICGKDTVSRFRINNYGYMNDVFEGKVFLKSMAFISEDIPSMQSPMQSRFIEKYFPQIDRTHEDLLPGGSNVYIGSLSVKSDSFPMWNGYSENSAVKCNMESEAPRVYVDIERELENLTIRLVSRIEDNTYIYLLKIARRIMDEYLTNRRHEKNLS